MLISANTYATGSRMQEVQWLWCEWRGFFVFWCCLFLWHYIYIYIKKAHLKVYITKICRQKQTPAAKEHLSRQKDWQRSERCELYIFIIKHNANPIVLQLTSLALEIIIMLRCQQKEWRIMQHKKSQHCSLKVWICRVNQCPPAKVNADEVWFNKPHLEMGMRSCALLWLCT